MHRRKVKPEEEISVTDATNNERSVEYQSDNFKPQIDEKLAYNDSMLRYVPRDIKHLGAKVISQRFKSGAIKGLRTKDELLGRSDSAKSQTDTIKSSERLVDKNIIHEDLKDQTPIYDRNNQTSFQPSVEPKNKTDAFQFKSKDIAIDHLDGNDLTLKTNFDHTDVPHSPHESNKIDDNVVISESKPCSNIKPPPESTFPIISSLSESAKKQLNIQINEKQEDHISNIVDHHSDAQLGSCLNSEDIQKFDVPIMLPLDDQKSCITNTQSIENLGSSERLTNYDDIYVEPPNHSNIDINLISLNNPSITKSSSIEPLIPIEEHDLEYKRSSHINIKESSTDENLKERDNTKLPNNEHLEITVNINSTEESSEDKIACDPNFASSPIEQRDERPKEVGNSYSAEYEASFGNIINRISNINMAEKNEQNIQRNANNDRLQYSQHNANPYGLQSAYMDAKTDLNPDGKQVHGGHPSSYPPYPHFQQLYSNVPYHSPYQSNLPKYQQNIASSRDSSFTAHSSLPYNNSYYLPFQHQPDYNAMVYAKWQEDYAKWYHTYCTKTSARQSRTNSMRSNIHPSYPFESVSHDFPGFNYQRSFTNDTTREDIANKTTAPVRTGRDTPLPYQSVHSVGNFTHSNTLLILNNNRISLLKLNPIQVNEITEFPGPLKKSLNPSLLLKYMKLTIKQMDTDDMCMKLIWQILYCLVKNNGKKDINRICDILFEYNSQLHVSSFYNSHKPSAISKETHYNITSACLNNDITSAICLALDNNNYPLAFALSYHDKDLHQKVMNRYLYCLDSQDVIRSFLSINLNTNIDVAFINNYEILEKWNQYVAVFLSRCNDIQCSSYISSISTILKSKGRILESTVCEIILDSVLNYNSHDFYLFKDILSRETLSLDLNTLEIRYLRSMEIYEYIKMLQNSKYSYYDLQIYKYFYSEILYLQSKNEKCNEYLQSISEFILKNPSNEYIGPFLINLLHLSKINYHILFKNTCYSSWIEKLDNILKNPSKIDNIVSETLKKDDHEIKKIPETPVNHKPPQQLPNTPITRNIHDPTVLSQNNIILKKQTSDKKDAGVQTNKTEIVAPQPPSLTPDHQTSDSDSNVFIPFIPVTTTITSPSLVSSFNTFDSPQVRPVRPSIHSKIPPPVPSNILSSNIPIKATNEVNNQPKPISETRINESDGSQQKLDDSNQQSKKQEQSYKILTGASKILTKLFRSRDEIYLPDDTQPSIVFDKTTNRYVDLTEEKNVSEASPPKLPPTSISTNAMQSRPLYPDHRSGNQMYLAPKY